MVTAASVLQTSRENIVTKVTEQAARMDGFLQRNNLRDIKTNLHLSPAYENNGKISSGYAIQPFSDGTKTPTLSQLCLVLYTEKLNLGSRMHIKTIHEVQKLIGQLL